MLLEVLAEVRKLAIFLLAILTLCAFKHHVGLSWICCYDFCIQNCVFILF